MIKYQELTIIIPTKNRSAYINSLIEYYNEINFDSTMIIADSSDEVNFQKIEDKISSKVWKYKITHLNTNILDVSQSILQATNHLKTKYCLQISDDDFLFDKGILNSIKFLNQNPNYVGCQGRGISAFFSYTDNKVNCSNPFFYRMGGCEENDPIKRVIHYSKEKKNIQFAIFKTEVFKKIWKNFELTDDALKNDFIVASKALLLGKVRQINSLYCLHLIIKNNQDLSKINNYFKINSLENFDDACDVLEKFILKYKIKSIDPKKSSQKIMYSYLFFKIQSIYRTYTHKKIILRILYLKRSFSNYFKYLFYYKKDLKLFKIPKLIIEKEWSKINQ